jgi:hypothetical protein
MPRTASTFSFSSMHGCNRVWGKPANMPGCFPPVGTGACWIDQKFGLSTALEEFARVVRARLAARINELTAASAGHEAETVDLGTIGREIPDSEIVVSEPRIISKSAAKKEIAAFLNSDPDKDAVEVADALNLDPRFVIEVCDELIKAGKVEFVNARNLD